jgi:hypothetical protein
MLLLGSCWGHSGLCCCLQLQLTWLKWLLPAGVFRRGFDQNHHQQQQRQRGQGSSLLTPLLAARAGDDQEVMQDVWFEAVDTLQHNGGDVQVRYTPGG